MSNSTRHASTCEQRLLPHRMPCREFARCCRTYNNIYPRKSALTATSCAVSPCPCLLSPVSISSSIQEPRNQSKVPSTTSYTPPTITSEHNQKTSTHNHALQPIISRLSQTKELNCGTGERVSRMSCPPCTLDMRLLVLSGLR